MINLILWLKRKSRSSFSLSSYRSCLSDYKFFGKRKFSGITKEALELSTETSNLFSKPKISTDRCFSSVLCLKVRHFSYSRTPGYFERHFKLVLVYIRKLIIQKENHFEFIYCVQFSSMKIQSTINIGLPLRTVQRFDWKRTYKIIKSYLVDSILLYCDF